MHANSTSSRHCLAATEFLVGPALAGSLLVVLFAGCGASAHEGLPGPTKTNETDRGAAASSEGSSTDLAANARGGQESEVRFSEEAGLEAKKRIEAIQAETLHMSDPHWAGEYYEGDGLGVNQYLYLAPESGFVFEWHGCLGLYDRNWGEVAQLDDTLVLQPDLENRQQGFQGTPLRFRWVQWGPRSYLLENGDVASFCNGLNQGQEPGARLRRSDRELPRAQLEMLPPDIRACLKTEPLVGTVTAVEVGPFQEGEGNWRYRDSTVTVDFGSAAKPFLGMEVFFDVEGVLFGHVVELSGGSTKIRLTLSGDDRPPAIGTSVSTRPRWADRDR